MNEPFSHTIIFISSKLKVLLHTHTHGLNYLKITFFSLVLILQPAIILEHQFLSFSQLDSARIENFGVICQWRSLKLEIFLHYVLINQQHSTVHLLQTHEILDITFKQSPQKAMNDDEWIEGFYRDYIGYSRCSFIL